jgi:hypothetical protein
MSAAVERISKAKDAILGKTYELSLVKGYVSRWGMVEAVRELIQNALDSESPFAYEFIPEEGGTFALRLGSEFTTLTPQTLLLGATSKAENPDAIGSFGEGYKIALLVLTRLGYDVDVLNGDLLWKPRFRFSRTFGDELLVIDESVAPDRSNKGLTFLVRGLSEADALAVRMSCLKMQSELGEVRRTELGDIMFDHPGKLYVGSLYVCETKLHFGYNFLPSKMRLERDRKTVDEWDMKWNVLQMWYATKDWERIGKMIFDQVPDVDYAEYNAPEIVREAVYAQFRKNHPGAILASSPQDLKEKIEKGMTKTVYVGGVVYATASKAPSYERDYPRLEAVGAPPPAVMRKWLSDNRSEMRRKSIIAFKALIERAENDKWRLP